MPRRSEPPSMQWQSFTHRLPDGSTCQGHRSAVPGGWIVMLPHALGGGAFFYDDPSHRWTGELDAHTQAHARARTQTPARGQAHARAQAPTHARAQKRSRPPAAMSLVWQPFLHVLSGSSPREGFRAAVPGGWFVMLPVRPGGGVFFYRDAAHAWGEQAERALASSATLVGSGPFARAQTLVEWEPVRHFVTSDSAPRDSAESRVGDRAPLVPSRGGRALQEAYRARVPGGWFVLVALEPGGGAFFFDDARGAW